MNQRWTVQAGVHRTVLGLVWGAVSSLPSLGQQLNYSDLEGMVVDAKFTRDQVHRRDGQTISVQMVGTWKIVLGGQQQGDFTYTVSARTARGDRQAKPISG